MIYIPPVGTLLGSNHAPCSSPTVTPSVTPTANALQLLFLTYARGSSTNPVAPTSIVGNGLTWVQIAASQYCTTGVDRAACYLYRAMAASPSTGTTTITHGYTSDSFTWQWVQITPVNTSGTNGSGAVVQTAVGTPVTDYTVSVDLAAFGSTANGTYSACSWGDDAAETASTGAYTLLDNEASAATAPSANGAVAFRPSEDVVFSWDITGAGGTLTRSVAVGVEIKAAL